MDGVFRLWHLSPAPGVGWVGSWPPPLHPGGDRGHGPRAGALEAPALPGSALAEEEAEFFSETLVKSIGRLTAEHIRRAGMKSMYDIHLDREVV